MQSWGEDGREDGREDGLEGCWKKGGESGCAV